MDQVCLYYKMAFKPIMKAGYFISQPFSKLTLALQKREKMG